jgi:alpha-glucosidase (family GH31 glycosyl hydrolase)
VVYLPKGLWTNYWTGKTFAGKAYYNILCPIDQVPIFVKEGSIIPTQEPLQYIGEKEITQLILDVYPNASSTFTLYDDDGKSLEYEEGNFNTTDMVSQVSEKEITLTINATKGEFKGNEINYLVKFHLEEQPSSITVNGKPYLMQNDSYNNGILIISPKETNKNNIVIVIKK